MRQRFRFITRIEGVRGGAPVLTGSGVSVEAIVSRIVAGESPESVARDYDMRITAVREAIELVACAAFGPRGLGGRVYDRMHALLDQEKGTRT